MPNSDCIRVTQLTQSDQTDLAELCMIAALFGDLELALMEKRALALATCRLCRTARKLEAAFSEWLLRINFI